MTTRGALMGGNTLLLAGIVIGILGLLNVVAQNRHTRWDLTSNKQFSLADQSLQIVKDLPQPVRATAYYEEDDSRRQDIQDLLREYETRSNGKLTFEVVDPIVERSRAEAAGIKELGTTVLQMGASRQLVTGSRESDVTSGLVRLTNPTQKKIYFTIGHGERRIDQFARNSYSQLKTGLEADNFTTDGLQIEGLDKVPDDASAIVIANPTSPFGDQAIQALKDYLGQGGKVMFLAEPKLQANQTPVTLNELWGQWGVEIQSTPVVEGNPQFVLLREPLAPVIAKFPSHRMTEGLNLTYFPTTTWLQVSTDKANGALVTPLLQTTDRSWAETNPTQIQFDDGTDPKGPLTIGVAIEADAPNAPPSDDPSSAKKARVVIFGDADFVDNEMQQVPVPSNNRDLFLNGSNWLAESESLISIRPKDTTQRNLFLTAAQSNLVLFSSTIFVPLIVLAIGGFVWWSRR
jgi:ABC-type uncharacterized transport system involved in gliding motility auxiliary subunit